MDVGLARSVESEEKKIAWQESLDPNASFVGVTAIVST
jgi:hypothetical protein